MTSPWRKSSRSADQNPNCVEARSNEGGFDLRDSKLGDASPVFNLSAGSFLSLLRAAR